MTNETIDPFSLPQEHEHEFLKRMKDQTDYRGHESEATGTDIARLLGLIAKYQPYYDSYYK